MSYLITYTGKRIDIPDPKPDQIDIADIATHLSRMPRFVGATSRFFSVAQHSLIVAYLSVAVAEHLDIRVSPQDSLLEGLVHDGHEYLMGDCPSPLKALLGERYHEVEQRIDLAIRARFHMAPAMPVYVKTADWIALMLESDELRGPDALDYSRIPDEPARIVSKFAREEAANDWMDFALRLVKTDLPAPEAKRMFLEEWERING